MHRQVPNKTSTPTSSGSMLDVPKRVPIGKNLQTVKNIHVLSKDVSSHDASYSSSYLFIPAEKQGVPFL